MDDVEKAIEYFEGQMELGLIEDDKQQESYETALPALEKQRALAIEKDIVIDEYYDGNTYEREIPVCPSCHNLYLMLKQPHCNQCGQKLDWSVNEWI